MHGRPGFLDSLLQCAQEAFEETRNAAFAVFTALAYHAWGRNVPETTCYQITQSRRLQNMPNFRNTYLIDELNRLMQDK